MKTIINIIDPGHDNTFDPGAVLKLMRVGQAAERLIKEADINIKMATRLYDLIANYQPSQLTRRWNTPGFVSLKNRVQFAKGNVGYSDWDESVRLISIHQNSYTNPAVNGLEIFYQSHSPTSKILASNIYESVIETSAAAGYIYNERYIKTAPFYLLTNAPCPAVLIECGFISNPTEREWLESAIAQITIPYAIAKTLIEMG